jgi:CRP-like cAMP-binding protein/Zn-dependent protease
LIVIVLTIVVLAASVIVIDAVRQRAKRRRALSVPALVDARLSALPRDTGRTWADLRLSRDGQRAKGGQLWERLETVVDHSLFRPKLAEGVEIEVFRLRWSPDFAMVANPDRSAHFKLEVWEAELLPLMDGSTTSAELVVDRLNESGALDVFAVTSLVDALHHAGFLDPRPLEVGDLVTDRLDPASPMRRKVRRFAKTLSIEWSGADRFVKWCYHHGVRWAFAPVVAILGVLVAIAGFLSFMSVQSWGRFSLGHETAAADSAILLGLAFVLTFAHEFGHAVVLTHNGRRIKGAGFMIYFGSPAFFVDASDGLLLGRWPRIVEAAAGPYSELVLAGAAAVVLWAFPDIAIAPLLYKFVVLNYFVIFLNLIPLLELDGYWILTDLIEVPDLRQRSLAFIQRDLWHKLRGRERLTPQEVGLGLYGIAGIAFTIFTFYFAYFFWNEIFGSLISSLWNGGTGSRLLLLLLTLILAGPAIRGAINGARTLVRRARAIWRRVRFKLESGWRVEAARLVDALPAFEDLPEDALSDLAGRVRLRTVRSGQAVFRQGDRATAFYVIRRGSVAVEEEDPDTGGATVLSTLVRGESFGELGLLGVAPRSTTVRAISETELFEVDKGTFDRLLADSIRAPEFALTLQSMAELREIKTFASLNTSQLSRLLEHGRWFTAGHGERIVEQGGVGDAFFAIRSGRADVLQDGRTIATLGAGDHFGEVALLRDVPRTASVVATTPLRAFRLEREGFDEVVASAFRRGVLKIPVDQTWQH